MTSASLKVGSLHSETMPRRLAYSIRHSCNTFIFSWWIGFGFTSVTERYIGGEKENEKKRKRERERNQDRLGCFYLSGREKTREGSISLSVFNLLLLAFLESSSTWLRSFVQATTLFVTTHTPVASSFSARATEFVQQKRDSAAIRARSRPPRWPRHCPSSGPGASTNTSRPRRKTWPQK